MGWEGVCRGDGEHIQLGYRPGLAIYCLVIGGSLS